MKKAVSIIFTALFLALCILPGAAYLCGYTAENRENRPLAREAELFDRSGLNLSFPKDFDDWWEDHFGLREELVTAFHGLTISAVRDTLNDKVIVGRGNYLYYSETLDDYLHINLLSDAQIRQAADVLRLIGEYCESRGMRFIFMNAPDKCTVYPEYMPSYLAPADGASNMERLYAALDGCGVETLDLASLLISCKDEGDLYYEQDTHWNARGARIAYRAIMELAAGSAEYDAYESDSGNEKYGWRGDLHEFVLPAAEGTLKYVEYASGGDYETDPGANASRDNAFGTVSDKNDLRLLMFRDSFAEALIPLISANAGRAVYSKEFPYNFVAESEDFDVVIIELVERNIPNLIASAPLMPGVETALPANAAAVAADVLTRQRSGYTQLYGSYGGEYAGGVFVELAYADGSKRVYEAFPLLDEELAASAGEDAAGFVLTLPQQADGFVSCKVYIS